MTIHIDINDPRYQEAAGNILRRHENLEAEANITSAIRDFLILTDLVKGNEINEENPPSTTAPRSAVDLTALDTFVESKKRVGTTANGEPNPDNISQIDNYLRSSASQGQVRMGVLTDGRRWILRWPGAGEVKMVKPYAFTLDSADHWFLLYKWLRDEALVSQENIPPDRMHIEEHFGPNNPSYQRDLAALHTIYSASSEQETIRIKRQLWQDLLRTALGEVANNPEQIDDLFIRHTYLSAVIGMAVQASFGMDIRAMAESNPEDLLQGRELRRSTGLQGVIESDFFAWPTETNGLPFLKTLARRIARFDWTNATPDTAATMYETVIPTNEREQLGEYYTPSWLAKAMIQELVTDPLHQRVLDPACGSGTFIAEAVNHFIAAAAQTDWEPAEVLANLREAVTGIDVHPVAVHLARAAWTLAARPAINAAGKAGTQSSTSIPVYLGDSLQLRFRTGDMFAEQEITIQVQDKENTQLVFPVSLVERAETFDAMMGDIAECIENNQDPFLALDDNGIDDPKERSTIEETIRTMQRLHQEGRNHIWAYYTRNMVRPVALSRAKVDVVIGNPPWLTYNRTASIMREEMQRLSQDQYSIWAGGRYATQQNIAALFFTRSTDLYLKDKGTIGFVMPHSALQSGQYAKWRTGQWRTGKSGPALNVDFGLKVPWDLEGLKPNTFFPMPASVVFASKCDPEGIGNPLARTSERWLGTPGANDIHREPKEVTSTLVAGTSPYAKLARNGATIFPRALFFVTETTNPAIVQMGQTITVNPRRGSQDKPPWKELDLTAISNQTIERRHLFDVHLGETVAPYVTLEPLQAILPLKQGEFTIPADANGTGGIRPGGLERTMRERWQTVSSLWDENKGGVNNLNLSERIDYHRELTSQLEWQKAPGERPTRLVYTSAGQPTAAILTDNAALVENVLFWIPCRNIDEANYLLAIINSTALYKTVASLMPKGQFGARHLHKHLWKLPIPEYDGEQKLHSTIAAAGATAAAGASKKLEELRAQRGNQLTVIVARRELRAWLRKSPAGHSCRGRGQEIIRSRITFWIF